MDKFINKVIQGDCLEKLKELEDNSIDSIVTDPPAGISFMGKSWDTDKGGRDNWIKWMQEVATECKRVLKPGGHTFVWAIPRTSHWTATAWENAGFEIRDVVAHVFGSGFPKSLNIGKAVDKLQGNEREIVGETRIGKTSMGDSSGWDTSKNMKAIKESGLVNITKGTSEWEGWGTALKPAREDWILMRKPLDKGLTIAENCLKWGTGGINIDESRVDFVSEEDRKESTTKNQHEDFGTKPMTNNNVYGDYSMIEPKNYNPVGRFPANLIHDNSEEVRECFPETSPSRKAMRGARPKSPAMVGDRNYIEMSDEPRGIDDNGGNASRFFKSILYYPKASKSERNKGCEGLENIIDRPFEERLLAQCKVCGNKGLKVGAGKQFTCGHTEIEYVKTEYKPSSNNHPTVKPIALMEYLIKMVTPKGGTVLDPFAGSGSTLVAAKQNGYKYIGIELTEEYIPIIEARLSGVENEINLSIKENK